MYLSRVRIVRFSFHSTSRNDVLIGSGSITAFTTLRVRGRMRVTNNKADSIKFRVPGLRNLDFTSYYFHDGRVNFPRNVLKFYETGVNQGPNLDPLLTNGISLTQTEEDNLVEFLRTLSDSTFLNNPRFRQ